MEVRTEERRRWSLMSGSAAGSTSRDRSVAPTAIASPPAVARPRSVEFAKLIAPMVVASLAQVALGLADVAIVGHAGEVALAAVAAGAAIFTVSSQFLAASAVGYQIMVARALGRDDRASVARLLQFGGAAVAVLALTLTMLLAFSAPLLTGIVAPSGEAHDVASEWLRARSLGLTFFAAALVLRMTFDASKQTQWGMFSAVIANTVNVFLTVVLVFGAGPVPALGAPGSAIASTIADVVAFAYFAVIFVTHPVARLSLKVWQSDRLSGLSQLATMARVSLPETINAVLDYGGTLVFVTIAATLGSAALAGSQIALTLVLVTFIVAFVFGAGIQILVGRSLGAGNNDQVLRIVGSGLKLGLPIFASAGLILLLLPLQVSGLFTSAGAVANQAADAIRIVGLCAPLMILATSSVAVLRAFGQTRTAASINIIGVWLIELPVAWVMAVNLGLAGLYLGFLAYFAFRATAGWLFALRSEAVPL